MKSPGAFDHHHHHLVHRWHARPAQPSQSPRFLTDVAGQFNALAQRPMPWASSCKVPIPDSASTCRPSLALMRRTALHLLVTRNGNTSSTCPGRASEHANMHIVKMGSRDKDGERMRSNRLRRNSETTDTRPRRPIGWCAPSYSTAPEWPHYDHPGGMQQIGDIVVLALEAGQRGRTAVDEDSLLDVRDPENPAALPRPFLPFRPRRPASSASRRGSGREGQGCAARPVTT